MRVAIYARFSSDLQDARSITDQLALAREHAARQGWFVVQEFTDAAISGASMANRPGLQELMRAAEARRFDAVLTESLDRLSRDLADSAALHRQLSYWGVRIVTLADGDVNKMLVAVKGLLGSMFLDDLAQKTKRGQVGRVKAGRIPGGRCYGYDVVRDGQEGGKRTINEAEAGVVRRIYAEYVEGRSPLKIVQALNAERVPGPRGGHWNVSALIGSAKRRNGLLNNSLYAGALLTIGSASSRTPRPGGGRPGPIRRTNGLPRMFPSWLLSVQTCSTVRRPCGPHASGHTPSTTVGRSICFRASSSAAAAAQA